MFKHHGCESSSFMCIVLTMKGTLVARGFARTQHKLRQSLTSCPAVLVDFGLPDGPNGATTVPAEGLTRLSTSEPAGRRAGLDSVRI
jgi:hypothetical protein